MKKNIIISAVATLILFSGCATTRDFIYLQDRIADLEKYRLETEEKQNQLNSSIGKINKSQDSVDQDTKTRYASLKAELTSLKQEIRTLNGRIDELNYMIENINNSDKNAQAGIERIEETGTENTNRIMRLEEYLGFENAAPKFKANGEIQVVKKETTSDDLYNRAKNSFDKNMFEPARIGFQKFINEYPDSENADNALFWIGETYYRQKQYKKAILEYQKVVEKYPKGNKVAAALLKQGLSFQYIGEDSNARLIMNELVRRFPGAKEADIARSNLKKTEAK